MGGETAWLMLRYPRTEPFLSVELYQGDGLEMAGILRKRLCRDIVHISLDTELFILVKLSSRNILEIVGHLRQVSRVMLSRHIARCKCLMLDH